MDATNHAWGAELARILDRELGALAEEVARYEDDEGLWSVGEGVTNSAGTLAVHVVGGLEHYVGAVLGGSGYERDREAEFSERGLPRADVLARIAACRSRMNDVVSGLSASELIAPYPGTLPAHMQGASTHAFLVHLVWHIGWHRGQIDYQRRLVGPRDA